MPLVKAVAHNYEYDIIVIGGGSGGLAASKEAARSATKQMKPQIIELLTSIIRQMMNECLLFNRISTVFCFT